MNWWIGKIWWNLNSKCKNFDDIIGITKVYDLLQTFQDSEDFILRNRINLSKYILNKDIVNFWKDFFIVGFSVQNHLARI